MLVDVLQISLPLKLFHLLQCSGLEGLCRPLSGTLFQKFLLLLLSLRVRLGDQAYEVVGDVEFLLDLFPGDALVSECLQLLHYGRVKLVIFWLAGLGYDRHVGDVGGHQCLLFWIVQVRAGPCVGFREESLWGDLWGWCCRSRVVEEALREVWTEVECGRFGVELVWSGT